MSIKLNKEKQLIFDHAIKAMVDFKHTFGRELKPDIIAEIYVARILNLKLVEKTNTFGYDAVDEKGLRYQIKNRSAKNIDINNFNFDFLILINLDDMYQIKGIWSLASEKVKEICSYRENHKKYQVTQNKFKEYADKTL